MYELFNAYLTKFNQRLTILPHVAKLKVRNTKSKVKKKEAIGYQCKGLYWQSLLQCSRPKIDRLFDDINGFRTNEEKAK